MILNVYCYYNKYLQAYGNFQLDDHEPEKVLLTISRDLRANVLQGKAENLRHLDLYLLGTFDDETGAFKNEKRLLIDLGSAIAGLEAQIKAEKEKEKKK